MKTLFENRIYQVSNIIAVLITAVVPLWVAFTTPSPFSEKRLQVSFPIISDITSVISSSKNREKINISMKINDELISNLVLVICRITNTGDIAIIPSDFYENLS